MKIFTQIIIAIALINYIALSRPDRVKQVPWGNINNCATCHISPYGGGPLNVFGQMVYSIALIPQNSSGEVIWGNLMLEDADGDGYSNGEELQDPNGEWSRGNENPGDSLLVTNPADPDDFPLGVEDEMEVISEFMPNPAINLSTIKLNLKKSGNLTINVFDLNGNHIKNISKGYKVSAEYTFSWNGKNEYHTKVTTGPYIVFIQNDNYTILKKIIIL